MCSREQSRSSPTQDDDNEELQLKLAVLPTEGFSRDDKAVLWKQGFTCRRNRLKSLIVGAIHHYNSMYVSSHNSQTVGTICL
jgi:hypothetical protein